MSLSAGGIVVRKEGKKYFVSLEQNKLFPDNGNWFIPKGHIESGETIEECARREIAEEGGIHQLQLITKLCVKIRWVESRNEEKEVHYFLFTTDQTELTPTAIDKPHQAKWFDLFTCGDISSFEEQNDVFNIARQYILEKGL